MTAPNWTARQRIVAGFAIVMASAGVLAGASLLALYWIDGLAQEVTKGTASATALHAAVFKAYGIVIGVGALGTLLSLASLWAVVSTLGRVLKNLAQKLTAGSEHVNHAAEQIAGASHSLAEGSSSQAASIEETSASLEEMASMTKRNAENASKANDLARQTRTAADEGVSNMTQMSTAMEAIKVSSDDIAKIIKTIDEIAFQTNILALNAAVEAARAGEAGMGFAVVADEVRNLAQRSAKAAKETADKIEGAITKTAQGVDINRKVAATLNDIVTKARQVDELAGEVAGASREQTQGITQINIAVGQMDKVTQNNAANAEETAAAAEKLNGQARVMKDAVIELQQLCGVSTSRESTAARVATSINAPSVRYSAKRPVVQKLQTNGNGHVNDHAPSKAPQPAPRSTPAARPRHSEIPMDGDFREF